ncbi:glycosyltransferase family 2 protein [Amycolatopsis sp. EV170708-02-1]|uniref:glycosyltransferase family 2 protein n=1 Tax=Amycolatopsis sp. EV170708-02-1 TaxID=2919322 RepID=UPI001F0B9710|nr:glycosyltransferase [Amycolatopsis sp. EV170708-02-1]UMP06818.1 glycosyltransferase [Amycolatopsis sp. EV170708-02-1]
MQIYSLMLALLLGWPIYNIVLSLLSLRNPRPGSPGVGRPLCFWLVVPALDEELVIAGTVRSLLALADGDNRLRVLVVDDGSTDRTSTVLKAIDDDRMMILRRELPEARQGKGAALNAAYRLIRDLAREEGTAGETVVGVVDADGRVSPNLLTEVDRYLADGTSGAVQCRVRIRNRDSLLGLLQDIEFGCVADAAQTVRDTVGTVALGGNGQFVKLSVLIALGNDPWSSCLVEDTELGLRLHRAGVRVRYVRHAVVTQQAVVDIRRLLRQRARWAQGNLQCARHLPGLLVSRHISAFGLVDLLHYLIVPWFVPLFALLAFLFLGIAVHVGLGGTALFPLTSGTTDAASAWMTWLGALLLPGTVWGFTHRLRLRDEPLWRCVLTSMTYPVFLVLGSVAGCRGVARHVGGRADWVKTERLAEPAVAKGRHAR